MLGRNVWAMMVLALLLFSTMVTGTISGSDMDRQDQDQGPITPFSDRNISLEIYPGPPYGGLEKTEKDVHPGSFTHLNFTVLLNGSGVNETNEEKIFVRINTSTVPKGWTAYLDTPPDRGNDNPDYVRLASGDAAHCRMLVWAPWEGEVGDNATIEIFANSTTDPGQNVSLFFTANLYVFYDFELFFLKQIDMDPLSPYVNQKWDTIDPGREGRWTISINNKGNVNDTYDIRLEGQGEDSGWEYHFIETGTKDVNVSLTAPSLADVFGGFSGDTFTIYIKAPTNLSAGTLVNFSIIGESRDCTYKEIVKQDNLTLEMGSIRNFTMVIPQNNFTTPFNGTVSVEVILVNHGNIDLQIFMSFAGKANRLGIDLPEERILVPEFGSTSIIVNVTSVWVWNEAKTSVSLILAAIAQGTDTIYSEPIIFHIPYAGEVEASVRPNSTLIMDPGDDDDRDLILASFTNYDEIISVSTLEQPDFLNITLTGPNGTSMENMSLEWMDRYSIHIHLNASEDSPAGSYIVFLQISTMYQDPILLNLTVNITFHGSIDLRFLDGSKDLDGSLKINDVKSMGFQVTNNGNGDDRCWILLGNEADRYPHYEDRSLQGWDYSFHSVMNKNRTGGREEHINYWNLSLIEDLDDETRYLFFDVFRVLDHYIFIEMVIGKGETWIVEFIVSVDTRDGQDLLRNSDFEAMVWSMDPSERKSIDGHIDLEYPDLVMGEEITFSDERNDPVEDPLVEGKYTLSFEIINQGNCSTDDFSVIISIEGEDNIVVDVSGLGPWETAVLMIPVYLPSGTYSIQFEIDWRNDVHENRDQFVDLGERDNNRYGMTIDVEEKGSKTRAATSVLWILSILIMIFAPFLIVLILLNRKKNRSQEEE